MQARSQILSCLPRYVFISEIFFLVLQKKKTLIFFLYSCMYVTCKHVLYMMFMYVCMQVVGDYDSISPLDPWMTTILLRIKRAISGENIEL